MRNKKIMRTLGNSLIVTSLLIFVALLAPLALTYIPHSLPVSSSRSFAILIPRISAEAPVIAQVDPWNAHEYQEALRHGVAHAKTTSLPGEGKTVYLFAHSSGMPWDQLYYNTVFLRLGELQTGDMIQLQYGGREYNYRVYNKKEVQPNEINYLLNTKKDQLILQTCTPIGTSLKRLLIFAEPVT